MIRPTFAAPSPATLIHIHHVAYTVRPAHVCSRSADSPLLWIRIDPDMSILRKVEFEQADFMWQYQLRYERDVVAQVGQPRVQSSTQVLESRPV